MGATKTMLIETIESQGDLFTRMTCGEDVALSYEGYDVSEAELTEEYVLHSRTVQVEDFEEYVHNHFTS